MSFGKLRIELLCPIDFFLRTLYPHRLRRLYENRLSCIGVCELRVRQREVRIGFNTLFEIINSRLHLQFVIVTVALVEAIDALQIKFVSDGV